MLHINQVEHDGVLIVALSGELDHHEARTAIDTSEDVLALYPCEKLILDLSGLTFMDSSGLAVVLHLHRATARSGRAFVVRGAPAQAMRVFEAAGLPQVMIFERGQDTCAK